MLIRKDVMKLTLPIIAEQTFTMIMGVINTAMAGRLGKETISAIGMIDSINNITITFFSALAIGGTIIVAQCTGSSDYDKAKKTALNLIISCVVLSLGVTVILFFTKKPLIQFVFYSADPQVIQKSLSYFNITLWTHPMTALTLIIFGVLRGSGDTRTPMKISIIMNIFNVILSYLFIYGFQFNNAHFNIYIPGLGIRGAAIGISLARCLGMIMITIVFFKNFLKVRMRTLRGFRFNAVVLKSLFKIGLPPSLESLMFSGGKLITQIFIVSMGTAVIAGNTITSSVFGLINIPGSALCVAAMTMVGQFIGKKDSKMAYDTLRYLVKVGTVCLIALNALIFPFAENIAGIYTTEPDVILITAMLIRSLAIAMPLFWSWSFILPSGLKGGGDVRYTLLISVLGMWIFRFTFAYILAKPMGFGILGIWIGMYIDWVVRGTLFMIRFKKNKWIHEII